MLWFREMLFRSRPGCQIDLIPVVAWASKLVALLCQHFAGQDFSAQLDRAVQRSATGAPIKLIEDQAIEVEE
jgi:hypothetical protein